MMPKFTKRHYELLARGVATDMDRARREQDLFAVGTIAAMAERQADLFAHDNPRFNRSRFLTACGCAPVNTAV